MTARLIPDPGRKQVPQPPESAGGQERDGWRVLSYMLGGMALYGGLGWLVGHWTGITILFPLGMILGIALSIVMIAFRYSKKS